MAAIKLEAFGGMTPAIGDTLIQDNAATRSENAWLYSGWLTGTNTPTLVRALTGGTAITKVYRIPTGFLDADHIAQATWMEFQDADTDVLRTQVVGDTFNRYYWVAPSSQAQYSTQALITNGFTGNDSFTKVLLHFEGADASTTFTDSNTGGSAHTWTAAANAQIDTADFKFGTASGLFDGTGDVITTPDHADFTLGSGDFTVDTWFKANDAGGTITNIAGQCDAALTAASTSFTLRRNAANVIIGDVCVGGTTFTVTGTTTFTNALHTGWHHVALVRSGTSLMLFIDGIQEGTTTAIAGTVNDSASVLGVGCRGALAGGTVWNGWLDEFRLSVGVARWTTTFTLPTTSYGRPWLLGIPAPAAPTIVCAGGISATNRTSSYVYTWVSAYGEEGPPSPALVKTGKVDDTWTVTLTAAAAKDLGVDRNLTKVRIYRTVTGANGVATYYLVVEQAIATTTYADTILDAVVVLNSTLTSTNYTAPPTDLKGWVAMPNGIVAAFRENEVWFCEPYRLHAWPAIYALAVDYPIVGLGVVGQSVVVCTQVYPWAITGVHPATMTQAKIMNLEPCSSRGSIVSSPEGVYYASPNGLVRVASGSATNITKALVTKDKWQQLITSAALNTLRAARLGTAYYGYGTTRPGVFETTAFDTASFTQTDHTGSLNGVLVDPQDARVAFNLLNNTVDCVNLFNDPWTGELLVIRNGSLYWINVADSNPTYDTYKWRSKIFQTPNKKNLGAAKVYFDVPSTTPSQSASRSNTLVQTLGANQYGLFRMYADGVLVATRELRTSGESFRLPSGYWGEYWQFEIEARVRVKSMQIAPTAKDLVAV